MQPHTRYRHAVERTLNIVALTVCTHRTKFQYLALVRGIKVMAAFLAGLWHAQSSLFQRILCCRRLQGLMGCGHLGLMRAGNGGQT